MARPRTNNARRLVAFAILALRTWAGEGTTLDLEVETFLDAETLRYRLNHWKADGTVSETDDAVYYAEGLPDVLFRASAGDDALILADLSGCLVDFGLATCLKFLLLNRANGFLDYLRDNDLTEKDASFLNGTVTFKTTGAGRESPAPEGPLDLDRDVASKLTELFGGRALEVNLAPGFAVDVNPLPDADGAVDFRVTPRFRRNFGRESSDVESGRSGGGGRGKRKKGGFQMPPLMIMPQLIMWGFLPFALANLQAMVMNAFMLNMMALNGAIFMTIRNLVFGPRGGPKIKYVNYGYKKKKKKSGVPTVIVHSPAAFVKQPFRRKRPPEHYEPQDVVLRDDAPTSYSEMHRYVRPNGAGGQIGEKSRGRAGNGAMQAKRSEGREGGRNRVRIRIESGSVREALRRLRAVEEDGRRSSPALSLGSESGARSVSPGNGAARTR